MELQERLDRGERQLQALRCQARMARWVSLSLLAGALIFVGTRPAATQGQMAMTMSSAHVTQVKGPLVVTDDAGRPILEAGTNPLGRGMVLFDESGKMVCGIGLTAQGRGLAVYDGQQKLIAGLGEGSSLDGTATGRGLTVFDPAQKTIGTLGMGNDGKSTGRGITLNDETGTPVAGLGIWPQRPDRGQLVLTGRNESPLFAQPPVP
jgi:hypothetical protein